MTQQIPSSVDELRSALLEAGEDPAKVASMKKTELKEKFQEIMSVKMDFELEHINSSPEPGETLLGALKLEYGSPEWQSYVVGLMNANELWEGLPKVAGLNRVANLLLGDIISSKATHIHVTPGETRSVTVNYEVVIDWKLDTPIGFGNLNHLHQPRTFGGVACCNEDPSSNFYKHPAAIAETKAFGRALRKALALNVIAAEEMLAGGSGDESSQGLVPTKPSAKITLPLKSVIEAKAKALNLNLTKVVVEYGIKKPLQDFTMEEARGLFTHINSLQQNRS